MSKPIHTVISGERLSQQTIDTTYQLVPKYTDSLEKLTLEIEFDEDAQYSSMELAASVIKEFPPEVQSEIAIDEVTVTTVRKRLRKGQHYL